MFVVIDEARARDDCETLYAVKEYVLEHETPAFSQEEKLQYAIETLDYLSEQPPAEHEDRIIRITQHMAKCFEALGLQEEATELRKQIVIHRRERAEMHL